MLVRSLPKVRPYAYLLAVLCALPFMVTTVAQTVPPMRQPTGVDDTIFSICFSPDGRTLAIARGGSGTSQGQGRVELWHTESGDLQRVIKGFDGPVWSVSFSPDGKTIVSGSSESRSTKIHEKDRARHHVAELKWWDANTGELKQQRTMPGENRLSLVAAYSPNGKLLATIEQYSRTMVPLADNFSPFNSTAPPPVSNPRILWTTTFSSDLKLLDAQTGEVRYKLKSGWQSSQTFRFSERSALVRLPSLGNRSERPVFSADGELVAVGTTDKVKLFNTQTGAEVRTLNKFKGTLKAIALSSDGRSLAVATTLDEYHRAQDRIEVSSMSEVRLYDIATGQVIRTLTGHNDTITSLAFAPNKRVILIGSFQREPGRAFGTVKLWDLETGRLASLNTGDEKPVQSLVLSPNGRELALQFDPLAVTMLDTQTWRVKHTFANGSDGDGNSKSLSRFLLSVKRVLAVAFSPDGKTLAGQIEEGGLKVWDPRTGEVKKQLANHEDAASMVAISQGGKILAEVSNETVRLWDLVNGAERVVSMPRDGSISSIALSPDGEALAIGSGGEVTIRNTHTSELIRTLAHHESPINSLTFAANGRTLASAREDGTIETWDIANGQIKKTFAAGGKVTALGFAPSGEILVSAGEDGSISIWELQGGGLQQKLKKHSAPVNAIAFAPDGQSFASGGDDRNVIIWEVASGKSKRILTGHDLTVTSLAFSADGRLIASGGGNASVVLWDVQTGKLNRVLN